MSEISTLQRTVASFVEEARANSTGVDLDEALGKNRGELALGGDAGSER